MDRVVKGSQPTFSKMVRRGKGHWPHSPPVLCDVSHWLNPTRNQRRKLTNTVHKSWTPRAQSKFKRIRVEQMENIYHSEEDSKWISRFLTWVPKTAIYKMGKNLSVVDFRKKIRISVLDMLNLKISSKNV